MSDFIDQLYPASFRGVPFAVQIGEGRVGRRVAEHEYPFRDKPWPEDIGRSTRRFQISGFLVTNSAIYGGGEVIAQLNNMIAAAETKGTGTLIHPVLGNLTVSIPDGGFAWVERWDKGRSFEITLACIEGGDREFPSAQDDTTAVTNAAADQSFIASAKDFIATAQIAIARGNAIIQTAVRTVTGWVGTVTRLANDATSLFNMIVDMPGNFGRYFAGATAGFAAQPYKPASTATVDSLIAAGVADRAVVSAACDTLEKTAAGADLQATAAAAQAVAMALLNATQNPADGVRLLTSLANFFPAAPTSSSITGQAEAVMQTALGALCRRAALSALARATALYQPSSADDAANIRQAVADTIDAEIQIAGDTGDDATFSALRALRAAIIADLDARGAGLPNLITVQSNANLPALVLAQRLYQDADRSDELVTEANPAHPAFMPLQFKALAD